MGNDPWRYRAAQARRKKQVEDIEFGIIALVVCVALAFGFIFLVGESQPTATVEETNQETTNIEQENRENTTATITIYNSEGNIMGQYSGVSNVEQKDGYILFYDENGKKNSIFLSEGAYANLIED